ncbi:reverse transcriptase domain-containing protein [Tanacetum coccineum]
MTTPVEKRNHAKFCEFHGEVRHNTDECMHLKKQIEEMLKARKISHLIKELKQNSGKEQPKAAKKGETSGKDKALVILMVQLWERVARQKITQSFSPNTEILFPPLDEKRSNKRSNDHQSKNRRSLHPPHGCSSVRQKKRKEVGKLVEAGIMQEVHYHDWLSNRVMVKKHDDSWRMCVDFKDLNKACPKDGYQLPEIDCKVESLCGFPFKKMPFSLRNAGATYQRLVDKAFHKQIGRNLEVYVDDLVIKSRMENEIVRGIEETFKTLREINMKLNPKKCTFGVEEVLHKVDAVLSLPSPKCLKEVQKLNRKLASLNRFLAKSAEKSLPFFKTLKKFTKKSDFHWTAEAEDPFKQIKQLIAELPMLTAPMEKEELIVYLAAAKETVSAVLMTEREAKQMHIYFVSSALRGPEINYTSMEKLMFALVHASKRLKRYFQAHPIIVITDQSIQQVLSRPEVAGRLQKWSIELGEYAIHYRPRVSVKRQILADFIVKRPEEDSPDTLMEAEEELPEP